MIHYPSPVPDGLLIRDANGKRLAAFCPRWWRVDRWLFWAWLALRGRRRGTARFGMLVGGALVEHDLAVYEVDA